MKISLRKKAIIHDVTTMLATSKYVLFPGHKRLLTTGTDDRTLCLLQYQYQWLAGGYDYGYGYDLEIWYF